jgi:dCMP deaminase
MSSTVRLFVNNWDLRFMEQAALVATWSKDPSTKCGAIIVDHYRRVLGQGFNGFPRGVVDSAERYVDRPTKYAMIVHSEANAILNARGDVLGCLIYTTKFPCSGCTKLIIQAGLLQVICPVQDPANPSDQRWAEDAAISRLMLGEAGVTIREIEGV